MGRRGEGGGMEEGGLGRVGERRWQGEGRGGPITLTHLEEVERVGPEEHATEEENKSISVSTWRTKDYRST